MATARGLLGGIDIGEDDAGDAVVEQNRRLRVAQRFDPRQRGNPNREGGVGEIAHRLGIEDAMLAVDEQELVTAGPGDAGDIDRTHGSDR
ncbi:MAG: hypothetical protein R3D67_16630 [Hyphomicrobiaceae bacterium]